MVHIQWQGRTYEYDPALIDVRTAVVVRQHTGMGLKSWSVAIDDLDPIAVQALYWVVLKQNGEPADISGLNFSLMEFYDAFSAAAVKQMQADIEAEMRRRGLDPESLSEGRDDILEQTPTSES